MAVERFAGTAAHQLAEPLVIAESSAILVAEELGADLDPLLRERLDAIGRGAARARRLMDALLADARTAGRPLELGPVERRRGPRGHARQPRAPDRRVRRARSSSGRCRACAPRRACSPSSSRTSSPTRSSTARARAATSRSSRRAPTGRLAPLDLGRGHADPGGRGRADLRAVPARAGRAAHPRRRPRPERSAPPRRPPGRHDRRRSPATSAGNTFWFELPAAS